MPNLNTGSNFNLAKGSRFNLAKEAPALKVAGIGLGWDPNEEENGPDFDLDVSAFLLASNGKVPADEYVVFYGSEADQPEDQYNERLLCWKLRYWLRALPH